MEYSINPMELVSSVPLPTSVTDRYLKLCKAEHLKVLLYIFRKMTVDIEIGEITENTGVSEYDVKEALLYWADAGVLLPKDKPTVKTEEKSKAVVRNQKPTRTDVLKRGNEDGKIAYMLREAQLKFGRNLKSNETTTLVWLYDDLGLDVSIILFIVQYAVDQNKKNMSFIEKTAVNWADKGIETIADAENELAKISQLSQCWSIVCTAFGIERRKPSEKEEENAYKWITEWKIPKDLLEKAYEECVDKKSKFSFAYTARIIENWHSKGIKTVNDLQKSKTANKTDGAAYDLDLYEKILNSKD